MPDLSDHITGLHGVIGSTTLRHEYYANDAATNIYSILYYCRCAEEDGFSRAWTNHSQMLRCDRTMLFSMSIGWYLIPRSISISSTAPTTNKASCSSEHTCTPTYTHTATHAHTHTGDVSLASHRQLQPRTRHHAVLNRHTRTPMYTHTATHTHTHRWYLISISSTAPTTNKAFWSFIWTHTHTHVYIHMHTRTLACSEKWNRK